MQIEAVKVRRLYLQVAEQLSNFISEGAIKPGERLPSERDLASQFGVSRPTIREAMIAFSNSSAAISARCVMSSSVRFSVAMSENYQRMIPRS